MNNRPILGILTEPHRSTFSSSIHSEASSYISTSHIKFLESAGARVVPVGYDMTKEQLYELLSDLNGLYIPGENQESVDSPVY